MIERGRDGGVELRLGNEERALLVGLVDELQELLAGDRRDEGLRRLFPRAYDDAADERAYRELTGDSLLAGRREALDLLARTAGNDRLSAEEADAWLRALNDLRLVLGTRLDVSEEALLDDVSPHDPRAPQLGLYAYLSWLQEQLVEALSPG